MKLKCGVVAIIIAIIVGMGTGAGIFAWGWKTRDNTKPSTSVQYITQETTQNQTVNTIAASCIVQVETEKTNVKAEFDLKNITNATIKINGKTITNT